MSDLAQAGKLLLILGSILVLLGGLLLVMDRVPWIGQLPGDVRFEFDNVKIYVPFATMLLLSIILTLLMNLIFR